MAIATVNPDATAIDGSVWISNFDTFGDLISGLVTPIGKEDSSTLFRISLSTTGAFTADEYESIARGVMLFDVAGAIASGLLPDGAIVTAANVSLYPNNTPNDNFGSSLVLTSYDRTLLASTTSLTASTDYRLFRDQHVYENPPLTFNFSWRTIHVSEYSATRHAFSAITAGTRIVYPLNDAAVTELNASITGAYPFHTGLMLDWDFDWVWTDLDLGVGSVAPTWVSNVEDRLDIRSSRHATQADRPQLNLTYYVGTGHAVLDLTGQKASAGDTLEADFLTVEAFT